jgi:HEAT repeat protein
MTARVSDPEATAMLALLDDGEPLVREAACWAAGEVGWSGTDRSAVVGALVDAAEHHDPLVREAAVAALGALGDDAGRDAVIAACTDRPAVRRRAVLALAAFSGPDVEAALARALEDPDWQTRQAAEDLTRA